MSTSSGGQKQTNQFSCFSLVLRKYDICLIFVYFIICHLSFKIGKLVNTVKPNHMDLLSRHCPLVFSTGTDQRSASLRGVARHFHTGSIFSHSKFSNAAFVHMHTCMCTDYIWLRWQTDFKQSLHGEEGRSMRKEGGGRKPHYMLWEQNGCGYFLRSHRLMPM